MKLLAKLRALFGLAHAPASAPDLMMAPPRRRPRRLLTAERLPRADYSSVDGSHHMSTRIGQLYDGGRRAEAPRTGPPESSSRHRHVVAPLFHGDEIAHDSGQPSNND